MATIKRIIIVLAAALLFVGCKTAADKPLTISVMSYNIRLGVGKDGDNSWEFRKPATAAMLKELQPDMFGVQEAYPMQIDYIHQECPEYASYGIGRDDGKEEGEHMSIFYKKDKFELLSSETFWLSETPEVPSFGWDAACRRTATSVLLKHKKTGKKLFYVNTHLDHVGDTARLEGLKLIVERIKSMNPDGLPLILTGDFNMMPKQKPILELDKMMNSARRFAVKTDNLATFNAWKKPLEQAAIDPDFKAVDPENLIIDYIYYTPGQVVSVPFFETVTKTFADIPFISDHYPVRALIELK